MPLLQLILILVLIGVAVGLVNRFGPKYMDKIYITIINVVVLIVVLLWLLGLFGVFDLGSVRVGR